MNSNDIHPEMSLVYRSTNMLTHSRICLLLTCTILSPTRCDTACNSNYGDFMVTMVTMVTVVIMVTIISRTHCNTLCNASHLVNDLPVGYRTYSSNVISVCSHFDITTWIEH